MAKSRDETLIVHESEESHNELTVKAIGDSTVTGNAVAKIFDLEGSFKTGGEEATYELLEGDGVWLICLPNGAINEANVAKTKV